MSINNPSTGGVSTSSNGTNNTIAKFTGTSSIANSSITDDGTTITLGEKLSFGTGIGAVNQITGPTDQTLAIVSGNNNSITMTAGNHSISIVNGTAVTVSSLFVNSNAFQWTSAGITKYKSISTVSNGIPTEYATVDLTSQSAAISATTLYAVPSSGVGMYRISYVATVTTAATNSSTLGGTNGFQIVYTDGNDSVVKTTPGTIVAGVNTNSTNSTSTGTISGCYVVYAKASTNIQYQMDYTSVGATPMQYNLHIKLEAL